MEGSLPQRCRGDQSELIVQLDPTTLRPTGPTTVIKDVPVTSYGTYDVMPAADRLEFYAAP